VNSDGIWSAAIPASWYFSLEGCQTVAGGPEALRRPPEAMKYFVCTPAGYLNLLATLLVAEFFCWSTGGLRYASTTGYYLTALQAEPPAHHSLTHHSSLSTSSCVMLCGDRVFDKSTTANA